MAYCYYIFHGTGNILYGNLSAYIKRKLKKNRIMIYMRRAYNNSTFPELIRATKSIQ